MAGFKLLLRASQGRGGGVGARRIHGSSSAESTFGFGGGGGGGAGGGFGFGAMQGEVRLRPVAVPKGPRANTERCADTISFVRSELSMAQRLMVKKFVNLAMSDGKKTKARALFFKAFERLGRRGDVIKILESAVQNVKPVCEVKRVRVAGATHNVPAAIPAHRQQTLSMRWLLEAARKRFETNKSHGMGKSLADELYDASRKQGIARKKRDDLHKLAEANRTLAHYRWW